MIFDATELSQAFKVDGETVRGLKLTRDELAVIKITFESVVLSFYTANSLDSIDTALPFPLVGSVLKSSVVSYSHSALILTLCFSRPFTSALSIVRMIACSRLSYFEVEPINKEETTLTE